jgi:nitroreductase/dihydropteridine reductase
MNLCDLQKRYSVKRFDPAKPVEPEQIEILKHAFHLCPSSINIQGWKMIVVESDAIKKEIATAGKHSNPKRLLECSHILILARRKIGLKHIHRIIDTTEMLQILMKNLKLTKGKMAAFFLLNAILNGTKHWLTNQVYLAMGFLLATCASNKIGSLPMEGINKRKIDRILNLGSEYRTVVAIAIGYPDISDATNPSLLNKSRLPFDEIVQTV